MSIEQEYEPEMWTLSKDDVYEAIDCIRQGMDYADAVLMSVDKMDIHEAIKSILAEAITKQKHQMEFTLVNLRGYGPQFTAQTESEAK